MADKPMFQSTYSFRKKAMDVSEVVECDISDAGIMTERGELESLRAELNQSVKILGFMASMLTHDQQRKLVKMMRGYREIG